MSFKEKYYILSDFDGTITIEDTNDLIYSHFGGTTSREIEDKYVQSIISEKTSSRLHIENIKQLTYPEFKEFLEKEVRLDPYFQEFYQFINDRQLDFAVVSGGFQDNIKIVFDQYGFDFKHAIYANKLNWQVPLSIDFLHDKNSCPIAFGPCGNCKVKVLDALKNSSGKKILYLGDGLTDRCAAAEADLLFAKKGSTLASYCQENSLDYFSFESFKDILQKIKSFFSQEVD